MGGGEGRGEGTGKPVRARLSKLPFSKLPSSFSLTEENSFREGKGTQTKLFGPDIFGWGGGLPRERVGAKKCGMSLEAKGNQTFGRDLPGFCRAIRGVPEKFEKEKFVFHCRSLLFLEDLQHQPGPQWQPSALQSWWPATEV